MSCAPGLIWCPYCDGDTGDQERESEEAEAFELIAAHLRDPEPEDFEAPA